MDAISAQHIAPQALEPQDRNFAAAPDASDVRQFQDIYWQESPGAVTGNDGVGQMLQLPGDVARVEETAFTRAMERMVEAHENGCAKLETLLERITGSSSVSPAQLLEVQIALADATTGLATYQGFDKKTDEGVKVLMTGQ